MFLGNRDSFDHLGYVLARCPSCGTSGVFTVYQTERKLTVYMVPTISYGQQQVMECRACKTRFAVPAELRADLAQRLMSPDQLATQLGRIQERAALPAAQRQGRTFYQVLQVDPDADPEVIEAAFKRLALKYHPDRSTAVDASAKMREILRAREILTDPRQRRAYDASLGIVRRPDALRPEEV